MFRAVITGTKAQLQLAQLQLLLAWQVQVSERLAAKTNKRHARSRESNYKLRLTGAALLGSGVLGIIFCATHLTARYNLQPVAHAQDAVVAKINKPKTVLTAAPPTMPAATPIEVQLPSVNIDAPVIPTGLKSDGTIAVPDTPNEAGWYDQSPTPGQLGPSIIVGHVDFLTGIAVFWRLRYIQPGSEIDIVRTDGSIAKFSVDSIQQYSDSNFPDSIVYGNIDHAGIRLITCGGVFDPTTRHYNQNTVVFGTLE